MAEWPREKPPAESFCGGDNLSQKNGEGDEEDFQYSMVSVLENDLPFLSVDVRVSRFTFRKFIETGNCHWKFTMTGVPL